MKYLLVTFLCLLSSITAAEEPEEVLVVARRIEIVIDYLKKNHKQHPITGNWYYVGEQINDRKVENIEDVKFVVQKKEA